MHSDELQSIDAISELLGLDRLFVKQSVDALGIAGAIEVVEGVKLTPTERTADILRLKELPSGIETIKIVATWNPIEQMAHHSEESIFMVEPNGVALFALGDVLPKVNWEDVSVIDPLLDHEHRLGKKIEITDVENSQARWLSLTLALYYDFVDHLTRFMLFQKTHLLRGLSHTLRDAQANGTWNIGDIFKGGSEPFDESAHPRVRALAESAFREQRDAPKKTETQTSVKVIPPRRIRETFLDILGMARKRVLILSPWINEKATNDFLLAKVGSLVQAGNLIIIGYGYDPEQRQMEVPEAVEKFLTALRTKEDAPAVALVRMGNMHAKFVGIDGEKALDGSYNFLSFAGSAKLEHCYFLEDKAAIREIETEARERLLLALDGPKALTQRLTVTAALGTPAELYSEVERDLDCRNLLQALMLCLNRHRVDMKAGWDKTALEILDWVRLDVDENLKPSIERVLEDWRISEPARADIFTLDKRVLPLFEELAT
ncbi:hypothetical protein LBMAG21_10140 [Armatimonadota bacterium]|nr:hypothetical protein LBMAG21_10140 [Armatimonadota bacterium]